MTVQSVNGAIGEYAVLVELLRRGFDAYLAHGRSQSGWDIKVYLSDRTEVLVQVKAVQENAVQVTSDSDFDVLVIVDLNKPLTNDEDTKMSFRILCKKEVIRLASAKNPGRADKSQTITLSKRPRKKNRWKKELLDQALNQWSRIATCKKG